MKQLVTLASIAFWAILAFALARAPDSPPEPPVLSRPAGGTTRPAPLLPAEVARHDRADDCWMIVEGQVYNFSAYIPQHPAPPAVILKYCGKDGTEGFLTKDLDRAHSNYARNMMANYLLGPLQR